MWHTSQGDRTLIGDEAMLVRSSIESMINHLLIYIDAESEAEGVESDPPVDCESGVALYDALAIPQRIALLHDVATHLLTDTEEVLPLSAELEACVAAIFGEIRDQVAIEIHFPALVDGISSTHWRALVRSAYQSVFAGSLEDDEEVPVPESGDLYRWEYLVESLCDAILWDRDFELADSFLDDDPGVSHHRRQLLGIDDDYFIRITPDPRLEEVYQLVWRTHEIIRAKPR